MEVRSGIVLQAKEMIPDRNLSPDFPVIEEPDREEDRQHDTTNKESNPATFGSPLHEHLHTRGRYVE